MKRPKPPACPTPAKRSHATPDAAEAALGRAWRKVGRAKYPIRYYLCPCGSYHLTAKP